MNDAAAKKDDVVMGAMEKGDGPRAACRGGRGARAGTPIRGRARARGGRLPPTPPPARPSAWYPCMDTVFEKSKNRFLL